MGSAGIKLTDELMDLRRAHVSGLRLGGQCPQWVENRSSEYVEIGRLGRWRSAF